MNSMSALTKYAVIAIIFCLISTACGGASTGSSASFGNAQRETKIEIPQPQSTVEAESIASTKPNGVAVGVGDNYPVSRALIAKMLALAFNDLNEIETLDREITFNDTDISKWYDKYINAVYIEELMLGSAGRFEPESPLTLEQAQLLLDKANPDNKLKLNINIENKDKPISYALWTELYIKLLQGMSSGKTLNEAFGIESKNVVVMVTPGGNSQLKAWNMVTDKGHFSHSGLNMEAYTDMEIGIIYKSGEVIAVTSLVSDTPIIKNAYITGNDSTGITVFSGGAERRYAYANSLGNIAGRICDIRISGRNALDVNFYGDITTGIIKRISATEIELGDGSVYETDDSLKVYSLADGPVKWKALKDITVGSGLAEFAIKDGKVCAGIITGKAPADTVRVAINRTGFAGLIHDGISLTSTGNYTVKAGNEIIRLSAGELFNVSANENTNLFNQPRIYISCDSPASRIEIKSIKRNWPEDESPRYRGIIEIGKEDGGYTVINELNLEEYLYAVVPSEMPTGYGIEACKVQAVTARSYAYNQLYANRYHRYGANIDDSVNCQVYNNIPENEISIQAVNDTKGMCLSYGGQVISANFFSTSAGVTANSGEVWAASGTGFPAQTSQYLQSKKHYSGIDYGDLSVEENARAFFMDTNVECYDSEFSWFRWNVEMTAQEITASVDANLKSRYEANRTLVKTLQPGGIYKSRPVESVGTVTDIEVIKRGMGGNIMEIKITGTKASVILQTEYNVRSVIRPSSYNYGRDIMLNLKNGTQLKNYSLMPSAFFSMEKEYNNDGSLKQIIFYGGGNGHGVGMSQNGVKGMIGKGFTFEQILKHYYDGVEIIKA